MVDDRDQADRRTAPGRHDRCQRSFFAATSDSDVGVLLRSTVALEGDQNEDERDGRHHEQKDNQWAGSIAFSCAQRRSHEHTGQRQRHQFGHPAI